MAHNSRNLRRLETAVEVTSLPPGKSFALKLCRPRIHYDYGDQVKVQMCPKA
jgi:hypothetical protein